MKIMFASLLVMTSCVSMSVLADTSVLKLAANGSINEAAPKQTSHQASKPAPNGKKSDDQDGAKAKASSTNKKNEEGPLKPNKSGKTT